MEWKDTVLKFYNLKQHRVTFKGHLYDFIYISDKRSVGMITEILGETLFTVAFFPSMKNDKSFVSVVNFNREKDFIIPRYENLLKFANLIIQKEIQFDKTVDIVDRKFSEATIVGHKLHERLAEMYKLSPNTEKSEYDMILYFICRYLGFKDIFK